MEELKSETLGQDSGASKLKVPEVKLDKELVDRSIILETAPNLSIATENSNGTEARIEQIRTELQRLTETPKNIPSSEPPIIATELKGFQQSPFKVVRNTVLYPTWEAGVSVTLGILGSVLCTIPLDTASYLLGLPQTGRVVGLAGLGYLVFEAARHIARVKNVSNFFKVTKVKPNKEKLLHDGTQITLDDFVGELHMTGLIRQWKLALMKDKLKRALIVSEGVLQGLINIGEKTKTNDPWFHDFKAFKGTSWLVNPRIAEKFGFEVSKPENGWFLSVFLRKFDKVVSLTPQITPTAEINTVWISREKFLAVYESGVIQSELAKIRGGLERRDYYPKSSPEIT